MPFLILLAVPAIGYLTFYWLNSIVNKGLVEIGVTARELCSLEFVEILKNAGLSVGDLQALCDDIQPVFWLGDASLWSGIASVAFFAIVFILSGIAGTNRGRLASIFNALVPLSLIFISLSTVVQGGIITYSLYAIQINSMGSWFPVITLGIGLGALLVALAVVRAAFSINRQVTMSQMAVNAEEQDYPELWFFVTEIANKVAAPVPNNIVLGLEPTFYATSANVKVLSTDKLLSGETLYISLPLMRLFSQEEFGAVIGHELGHFKGEDVKYTVKFAPVYRALSVAVNNASEQGQLMAIPALSVLSFILERFAKSEREVSRQREFEADKVGANATSNTALCAALVKITAFSNVWSDLTYDVVENLEYGRPVRNLSKLYASRVAFDTDAGAAEKVVKENLEYRVSHPTDTHPTLSDRLKNLSAENTDFSILRMGMSDENASVLVNKVEDLETELSMFQQKIYQVTGRAIFETNKPENADKIYAISRVIQTAAAVMVCADGQVQPSEIAEAEEKGQNMITHFNSLEFRELCLAPERLPGTEDLSKMVKGFFSDENLNQLIDFLRNIAASDGNISAEEEEFIRALEA